MEPLIGVTCYIEETVKCEKTFSASPLYVSYPQYNERLSEAGAVSFNIPSMGNNRVMAEKYADELDGLLICGGEDIDPKFYHEREQGKFRHVPARDEFEFTLLDEFFKKRKPILGICRGLQVINVYFGGTLIQDIQSEGSKYLCHTRADVPTKGVHFVHVHGSWADKLGQECAVNSLHHQAIKSLGEGLRVIAEAEDGIIEAVERPNYPFLLAVQWHPELLLPIQTPIFNEFVRQARMQKIKAIRSLKVC